MVHNLLVRNAIDELICHVSVVSRSLNLPAFPENLVITEYVKDNCILEKQSNLMLQILKTDNKDIHNATFKFVSYLIDRKKVC